jgi:hypothetical protein
MRYRFILLGTANILINLCSLAQQSIKLHDTICWDEGLILEWKDFEGIPDTTNEFSGKSAVTATHVQCSAFWDKELPNFRVTHIFYKTKSWTLDTTSLLLLKHERLHFDISELCTRKIRKGVEELRKNRVKEMGKYVAFIQEKLKEMDSVNENYDDKTWNGAIDFLQKEWNEKIATELEELKAYASHTEDCETNLDYVGK